MTDKEFKEIDNDVASVLFLEPTSSRNLQDESEAHYKLNYTQKLIGNISFLSFFRPDPFAPLFSLPNDLFRAVNFYFCFFISPRRPLLISESISRFWEHNSQQQQEEWNLSKICFLLLAYFHVAKEKRNFPMRIFSKLSFIVLSALKRIPRTCKKVLKTIKEKLS